MHFPPQGDLTPEQHVEWLAVNGWLDELEFQAGPQPLHHTRGDDADRQSPRCGSSSFHSTEVSDA